jgi:thymidylate synthase (FAD)
MEEDKGIELYGDGIGKVEYVEHMGSDLSIVNSARVSFGKHKAELDAKDEKLIKYLIKHRHTSTLEHCLVTYRFKVPLFIRSQHHRHRTWSYNEISRRYTEENLQFYEPRTFRTQSKSNRQASNIDEVDPIMGYYEDGGKQTASTCIRKHHVDSVHLYNQLMDKGVCREQARGVLPQNLYTEYYGTCNLNNLIKFIELRTHDGAQWEIQQVAHACLSIAENLWPIAIQSYREIRGLKV